MMFSLEKGCVVLLTLLSNFGVAKIHVAPPKCLDVTPGNKNR